MNAAFLLVTTAWFAGDTAGHAPAPAANACCATTCSSDCCDSGGRKLLGKLRGMFKRDRCDSCAPQCETSCQSCESRKLFHFHRTKSCDSCAPSCAPTCAPAPCAPTCCDPCDSGCGGHKLLGKMRGMFKRDRGCCDNACDNCAGGACHGGTTVMPKAGETITTPPKKMPNPNPNPGKEPPVKEVRIDTPPALAPVAPAITTPAQPVVQPAPPIVPSVESDNLRSPF